MTGRFATSSTVWGRSAGRLCESQHRVHSSPRSGAALARSAEHLRESHHKRHSDPCIAPLSQKNATGSQHTIDKSPEKCRVPFLFPDHRSATGELARQLPADLSMVVRSAAPVRNRSLSNPSSFSPSKSTVLRSGLSGHPWISWRRIFSGNHAAAARRLWRRGRIARERRRRPFAHPSPPSRT
jgi:hypothetical protein